jgi:hypothetical protein
MVNRRAEKLEQWAFPALLIPEPPHREDGRGRLALEAYLIALIYRNTRTS